MSRDGREESSHGAQQRQRQPRRHGAGAEAVRFTDPELRNGEIQHQRHTHTRQHVLQHQGSPQVPHRLLGGKQTNKQTNKQTIAPFWAEPSGCSACTPTIYCVAAPSRVQPAARPPAHHGPYQAARGAVPNKEMAPPSPDSTQEDQ